MQCWCSGQKTWQEAAGVVCADSRLSVGASGAAWPWQSSDLHPDRGARGA